MKTCPLLLSLLWGESVQVFFFSRTSEVPCFCQFSVPYFNFVFFGPFLTLLPYNLGGRWKGNGFFFPLYCGREWGMEAGFPGLLYSKYL